MCNAPEIKFQSWPTNETLAFGNCPPPRVIQKVISGRQQFEEIVHHKQSKDELVSNIMTLLQKTDKYWPDEELKFRAPDWGKQLSSICVKMPEEGYGSR